MAAWRRGGRRTPCDGLRNYRTSTGLAFANSSRARRARSTHRLPQLAMLAQDFAQRGRSFVARAMLECGVEGLEVVDESLTARALQGGEDFAHAPVRRRRHLSR